MMIARGAGRRPLHARAAILCVWCCACSCGLAIRHTYGVCSKQTYGVCSCGLAIRHTYGVCSKQTCGICSCGLACMAYAATAAGFDIHACMAYAATAERVSTDRLTDRRTETQTDMCRALGGNLPPPQARIQANIWFSPAAPDSDSERARLPCPYAGGTTPPAAKKCRTRSWGISPRCSKRSWPMWSGQLPGRAARAAQVEAQDGDLSKQRGPCFHGLI